MPKRSSFPIRRAGGEARTKPWCLDVPGRYTEHGRRERRFYATQREAQNDRRKLLDLREEHGAAVRGLSPSIADEAARASRLLEPTGATLTEAAARYLEWWRQHQASRSFTDAWEAIQMSKSDRLSPRSVERLRYVSRNVFPLIGDRLLCDITTADLEALLAQVASTDAVRTTYIRALNPVFRRGVALGWCASNPLENVERPKSKEFSPEILAVAQTRKLLETCSEIDAELVPYFAVALFAGVRPDECKRLTWSDIDFSENHIRIKAEDSKTRTRRYVDIEGNLAEWLLPFRQQSGLVTPQTNFRKRFMAARQAAGLEKWQPDVCRHSYCSYHLAHFQDVNKLRANVGHRSPDILFRHYVKSAKSANAAKFWQITPPAELAKIRAIG